MDCSSNPAEGAIKPPEFRWIGTEKLRPNPWNPNRMSAAIAKKLSAEIKAGGMILPIVVRPIPVDDRQECRSAPEYQIVDGEHRWQVAKELGMERAPCMVVDLDDAEARLKTIQLNRLQGEDDVELLARLLRDLNFELGPDQLAKRLPLERIEIEQMISLLDFQESDGQRDRLVEEMSEKLRDRLFSVLVTEEEKAGIERAVHLFNSRAGTTLRPGSALARICAVYVEEAGHD